MKSKRYGRMSVLDEHKIIAELDQWAEGQRGTTLTWEKLEDAFGFSRQTLNQKKSIKAAYALAKEALSGGKAKSKAEKDAEISALKSTVERLEREISEHVRREGLWRERWQRIAFHIRMSGLQVHQVDKPAGTPAPTERETAKILRPFDKEIPSPYPDNE
ncbi:protein kinase [Stenotrophomonas sp. AS1]|uniref:protein kinase n=1 Tax=Stenotrophomonas sp. AS1 TaxID=3029188 RepID=UPI003B7A92DE